jgi:hypothetical protein
MAVCHHVPDKNRAPQPTMPADGRAFRPCGGCYTGYTGYTRYIGCSISPLSQSTRRGATLIRHAHGDLVIAGSAR